DNAPGLSDYLVGDADPKAILRSIPIEGPEASQAFVCIVAGSSGAQPAELLGSARSRKFFEQVTRAYDLVVIDTSPLLPVGDTRQLLPLVDAVLLCVRVGQTTHDQAQSAQEALDRAPARPVGVAVPG